MSVATVAVISGGIDGLTANIDQELRNRQLNDTYISFESVHFEPLYMAGLLTEAQAGDLWNDANSKMNQDLIDDFEQSLASR